MPLLSEELSGPVLRDAARLSQRYPPIARYGVFGVSTWPIWCDTPSPFLSVSPLESIREVEVRYPPPQKGYLSDTCAIPCENKANGCDTPSAILSRKGIARYGGASSHWAAKQRSEASWHTTYLTFSAAMTPTVHRGLPAPLGLEPQGLRSQDPVSEKSALQSPKSHRKSVFSLFLDSDKTLGCTTCQDSSDCLDSSRTFWVPNSFRTQKDPSLGSGGISNTLLKKGAVKGSL